VRHDNCISFDAKVLQIPPQQHRCHFVKAKVRVHRYLDDTLAVFYGPRCLARYQADGQLIGPGQPLGAPPPVRRRRRADFGSPGYALRAAISAPIVADS